MDLLILGFSIYLQLFMPPAIRKEILVAYAYKIVGYINIGTYEGIMLEVEAFWNFEYNTGRHINWNGQIIVQETMLTDRFNVFTGQNYDVKIEDAFRSDYVYFFNEREEFEPIYVSNHGEAGEVPIMLSNLSDYENDFDFIVRVYKANLTDDEKSFLAALVDKYRLVGKSYKILAENE